MPGSRASKSDGTPAQRGVRIAGEAVLVLLAFASAWPFGSVDPFWEAVATGLVALLGILWAAYSVLTRRLRLRFDMPALVLSGLILLSGLQLVPLPRAVVGAVSPAAVRWRDEMTPAITEQLPGEGAGLPRPNWFPISLDPTATRLFACRMAALLAVYLIARNWLATRESFRRMAWFALINGVALAAFALGQHFSSPPNVLYWSVPTAGAVFGPFVCRNHFPDCIELCAGLSLGIMVTNRKEPSLRTVEEARPNSFWEEVQQMVSAPLQLLQQPEIAAAAGGVGLMLISIPFSLSRGGMLAFVVAAIGSLVLARGRIGGTGNGNRLAVTLSASIALAVIGWFGWQPIEQRFDEIGAGKTADDRTPLWKSTLTQVPGFWLGGAGNGSHVRIEPLGRSESDGLGASNRVAEHAHNEFVEALIEGGIPRLALTLAFPAVVLISLARGFRRQHARSAAPLILGAWFGIAVVAAHAASDFALHIPAISLLAITVTAYAMAAANDSDFQVVKQRRRASAAESAKSGPLRLPSATVWKGWPAITLSASLATALLMLSWDARQRWVADRYFSAGIDRGHATPLVRIGWLRASLAADPRNPDAYFQLAQAHLDAATELDPVPAEAVAGPVLPTKLRNDRFSNATIHDHIGPALHALQAGRDLCPLIPEIHARFGLLARYCERGEPALAHLERAKRILKIDSEIWYACGLEQARAGERDRAIADWKESLKLSPQQLKPILLGARDRFTTEDILDQLLPDDPVVLLGAADDLYPDRRRHRVQRLPFLLKATSGNRTSASAAQWMAIAKAESELEHISQASAAWERAIDLDPEKSEAREGSARMFEEEELYEDALPQLEWLASRRPADSELKLRLLAAQHGAKLQRQISR